VLVEVLGELHGQRLAPGDVLHEREAPVLTRAVRGVEQLHGGEPAPARQQLVGLGGVVRAADERRVQEARLLDRHGEVVDVGQPPDAHVDHRPHLRQRRPDDGVGLRGRPGQRRAAQVLLGRRAVGAGGVLGPLGDVFLGVLELIDL
jgi:hypothetical protein